MIINQVVSGGGTTPTGTKSITANGVYDVAGYANADVQVPTTAPAHYIEKAVDANNKLVAGSAVINLSGIVDIGTYQLVFAYYNNTNITGAITELSSLTMVTGERACYYMFQGCSGITSVDLSSLTTVSGSSGCSYMFYLCTGLTSVDLSSLTTVSGSSGCSNMFNSCTGLTSVDLSSLTTVSGGTGCASMFAGCRGLTSVDLPSLTTMGIGFACQNMFSNCTGLTSVDLPSLVTISGNNACQQMFNGCTSLTRISFYALDTNSFGTQTNQFNNMLSSVTGCTVHFPMRIQPTIGSWASVTGGFGGTNTTVLFDIVCTLTGADTNTYTRSQKNSTSTATAWDNGGTLYYTSGTSEPAVSDTIYSDAACTTAVTTISSIA